MCGAFIPRYQSFCTPACMKKGYGAVVADPVGVDLSPVDESERLEHQQRDIDESVYDESCRCEPCPIDLKKLFPGAKIFYENQSFKGTRCPWHWIIKGRRKVTIRGRRRTLLSEISPSGDGLLWIDLDVKLLPYLEDLPFQAGKYGLNGARRAITVGAVYAPQLGRILKPI